MSLSMKAVISLGMLWLIVLSITPAIGEEWTEAEREIWKMEEKYWESWEKGVIEELIAIYDAEFIGWPASSEKPENKDSAEAFASELLSQYKLVNYKIEPLAIRRLGDVAIVHYYFTFTLLEQGPGGKATENRQRITHTWIKRNQEWKILGGMSSN